MKRPLPVTRTRQGGSLALTLAITLGVVLVVFAVVIAYNQLFTHQREAQTAVDAAALRVAQEISKVTVRNSTFGWIGVCDKFQPNGLRQQPVYGINSLVGRARLDQIIARHPSIDNATMKTLANRDSGDLAGAATSLRNTLLSVNTTGTITYQVPPGETAPGIVNLKQLAADAYNLNNRRAGNQGNIGATDVTVELGYMSADGSGFSEIPIPQPWARSQAESAQFSVQDGANRLYKAGVNVPVAGDTHQYVFSAVSTEPRLVDRTGYTNTAPSALVVPSVVRVSVRQNVTINNTQGNQIRTGQKTEIACATAGGQRVPTTAGTLRIEFPQGIPQDTTQGNYFSSLKNIMNAPQSAWGDRDAGGRGKGGFFTAQNGPFPGQGRLVQDTPPGFPSGQADPAEATSYYVYDWLRNDGLRPNVDAVANALNAPLRSQGTAIIAMTPDTRIMSTDLGNFLMPPAYAADCTAPLNYNPASPKYACNCIWGAIFQLEKNSTVAIGGADPRSRRVLSPNNAVEQAFVFRMQVPAGQQMAYAGAGAMCVGINEETGCPTTTDSNPLCELLDFYYDLSNGHAKAVENFTVVSDYYNNTVLPRMNELIAAMQREVNAINSIDGQIATIDAELSGMPAGPARDALLAARDRLLDQRAVHVANYNTYDAQYREEGRKWVRCNWVALQCADLIMNINTMLGELRDLTALGLDRTYPTDWREEGRPRAYTLAGGAVRYNPPESVVTTGQIVSNAGPRITVNWNSRDISVNMGSCPTGQAPGATGTQDWLDPTGSGPVFLVGNPGAIPTYNCPGSTRPFALSRNFVFASVGDSSHQFGKGQIQITVTQGLDNLRTQYQPNMAGRVNLANFANVTGVSALAEGQSDYQALNILQLNTECDRRSGEGRMKIFWSVTGQNEVARPGQTSSIDYQNTNNANGSTVDVRNGNTPGVALDCARSNASSGFGDRPPCDVEAVRIQFTSPLPNVPGIRPITPPTMPAAPMAPSLPPDPPPPPPPPPPPSH